MIKIDQFYYNVAIQALLEAYYLIKQTTIEELLKPTKYGKRDTKRFDSFPESSIRKDLLEVDPDIILITEERDEAQEKLKSFHYPCQPVVFIGDPTDRSAFLENFFKNLKVADRRRKFQELMQDSGVIRKWEEFAGGNAMISGATCALTGIKKGIPFFGAIINYITGDLFVGCELGNKRFNVSNLSQSDFKWITLEKIQNEGENIVFNFKREWENFEDYKNFVTFVGKEGYKENLENSQIFLKNPEKHLVYNEPGGATRILYLSSLWKDSNVGFIMANGEKIIEWIHWIPFIAAAQREGSNLKVFEIFFERPWTKDGILTATGPAYSIFSLDKNRNFYLVNIEKIKDHPKPARFRSTILVASEENRWVSSTMETHEYTELRFSF